MVMRNYRHNTIIYLERLSDEDCWCIFQRHVIEFSDLSEMQNDIVRKCKGLPLAAKTLGGLLRKAIDKSHHQRILDSNIWSEESSVLPVLRLPFSGDGDHKLWMAQGFLPENTNERIEDVGHNCFLDLVSWSLIKEYTPDVEEFIFEEGPRMFTMHDLIHDLAKWAAGDLCCVIDTVNNDLKRMRHMYVTETGVNEEIPSVGFIVKLHHLSVDYTCLKEMPLGIEKIKSLQSLDKFVLAPEGGSRVRELGELNHLHGRLIISGLENLTEVEDALEARLHDKDSVDKLHLKWVSCWYEVDDNTKRDVLEKLRPHTSIKECKLDGYRGSTLPSWLGDPSFTNMVHIRLEECEKCECLPPLGQLPSLKSLLVKGMNGITEVGDLLPHLPSLRTLEIKECEVSHTSLPVLEVELQFLELKNLSTSTSRLEELSVEECEFIVSISHIPLTLQSLEVDDCEKLRYVEFNELSVSWKRQ
uniref:NB-ARC domain-containing protein n=1 Tax=Chenopodium quinoa TaxID=63459 RepID=A0A803MSS1_CHEQI